MTWGNELNATPRGRQYTRRAVLVGVTMAYVHFPSPAAMAQTEQRLDLNELLSSRRLRPVNREATPLEGPSNGVHLAEGLGPGVVWIEGVVFSRGAIEVDVRGQDLMQRSFVGIAFSRLHDDAYEAVYVRPFNFRPEDPARRQHAVQYVAVPEYDWPRLRAEFPEEFENPVDGSVAPDEWFSLRLVITDETVLVYVGDVAAPTLEVRRLSHASEGDIGFRVGNFSRGDFANLRLTPVE